MNAVEERLAESLNVIAADAAPARLPTDLWARGRRRRRGRVLAAAAAVMVLALLVVSPFALRLGAGHGAVPAEPAPAIPRRVDPPLPFTSTVQHSPSGPAALVVSGVGSFHGSDASAEGRNVVVGTDGMNRLVNLYNESADAGYGTYLSPDGRLLATDRSLQGAGDQSDGEAFAVLDLITGAVRTYPVGGTPVAWSPDGRSVLVNSGGLRLVEVASGAVRPLGLGGVDNMLVAFSPDGRRLAVEGGQALWVVDLVTGLRRELPVPMLGSARRLAGPGAWTVDGRLAMVELVDCEPNDVGGVSCSSDPLPGLRITYLDAETGTDAPGPRLDRVNGMAVRLLGWQSDGDAVVAVFQPPRPPSTVEWRQHELEWSGGVRLVALRPGGGQTELVELPASVTYIDVARDLLVADRFGGPTPSLPTRWGDWAAGLRTELTVLAGVLGLVVAFSLRRRIRDLLRRWFASPRSGSP